MEISSIEGAFSQALNDSSINDPVPITTTNNNNEVQNHLTFSENENNFIPTIPNKPEVKIKKLEEAKVITDSNENSLSVDTLIEILSSNGTTSNKLPEKTTSSVSPQTSSKKSSVVQSKATATAVKNKLETKLKAPSSTSSSKKNSSSTNNSKSSANTVNSNKLASPFGGKPTITDLNRRMKQASRQRQPRAVYQSQISDNSVGIKICIKKSINSQKKVPSGSSSSSSSKASPSAAKLKKRSRKGKLKEREGSDSEDGYVKRRKKVATNEHKKQESSALDDGPVQEQSRWATHMPKEILFEVR